MKRRPLAKRAAKRPIGNSAKKDEPGIAARKSKEADALCIDFVRYGGFTDHKIDKLLDILRTFGEGREVAIPAHI